MTTVVGKARRWRIVDSATEQISWQRSNLEGITTPSTLRWFVEESYRRRLALKSGIFVQTTLLSYPRSGSHALRGMIEMLGQRPTLGDGDSELFATPRWLTDRPIFLRANIGIPMRSLEPLIIKRHRLLEASTPKLLFLVRNPIDAILSHTKNLPDGDFLSEAINVEVAAWVDSIRWFHSWEMAKSLLVNYEDLITRPTYTAERVVDFLGVSPTREAFRHFREERLGPTLGLGAVHGALSANDPNYYQRKFSERCLMVRDSIASHGDWWSDHAELGRIASNLVC